MTVMVGSLLTLNMGSVDSQTRFEGGEESTLQVNFTAPCGRTSSMMSTLSAQSSIVKWVNECKSRAVNQVD